MGFFHLLIFFLLSKGEGGMGFIFSFFCYFLTICKIFLLLFILENGKEHEFFSF
jgi:heme/copper-type cytochrome/quinol oxidase subunit 4